MAKAEKISIRKDVKLLLLGIRSDDAPPKYMKPICNLGLIIASGNVAPRWGATDLPKVEE